jgi:hypothetical protein
MASGSRWSEPDRSVVARDPETPNPIGRRLTLSRAGSASMTSFAYCSTTCRALGTNVVEDPRVDRRPVGGHLARTTTKAHAQEECPCGRAVAAFRQQTINAYSRRIRCPVSFGGRRREPGGRRPA